MNTPDERVFASGPRRETPPSEGELRVVYHGGLADRFGVETLVRAVASLRGRGEQIALDIYGSDAEAAARLAASPPRCSGGCGLRAADPGRADPGARAEADLVVVRSPGWLHRAVAAGQGCSRRAYGPGRGRLAPYP